MKSCKQLGFLAIPTLLAAGYIVVSPAIRAADIPTGHSEEVTDLLSTAETEAIDLKHDAAKMESFTRSKLSWESHSVQIAMIKEHVNKVGELLTKLHAERETAASWQQQAIDRIGPLLKQLAANTTAMISHMNENPGKIHMASYRDYAVANSQTAERLAALIGDFVEYGEATEKLEALNEKLVIAER